MFAKLKTFLSKVPSLEQPVHTGRFPDGNWWVKFRLDIDHKLTWSVVQEFGNVLNELSATERLPTVFKPTSPPTYLNGGPRDFLFWVIESTDKDFTPKLCAEWLQNRLPVPVNDELKWNEP